MEIFGILVVAIIVWIIWSSTRRKGRPGRTRNATPPHSEADIASVTWDRSENGNPILYFGKTRLTVFRNTNGYNARGGWKFCIAQGENDDDPFFSGEYANEHEAKYEGLARLRGLPSKYDAVTRRSYESVGESHRRFLRNATIQTDDMLRELDAALADPAVNVTRLRPLERRLDTKVRQFNQTARDLGKSGDPDGVKAAYAMLDKAQAGLESARTRIAELKAPAAGD